MAEGLPKVNVAVSDRVLLHLLHHDHLADRFIVTSALTRPGIAEACAQHPPNVSRTMRDLVRKGWVSEHTRSIQNDDRRQKTWQLTEDGRDMAKLRTNKLGETMVLVRDKDGQLLEIESKDAADRLASDMSLLQVLLHAQHEGVLTWGDIRFGLIKKQDDEDATPPPGRLQPLAGVHATYHTSAPQTRKIRGREKELKRLDDWFEGRSPFAVVSGIAGIGKSTLVAEWLTGKQDNQPNLSICWYPCQPWDREVGLAVSLLHRFGIDEKHDPYNLIETLPLRPGAPLDVDTWRRRLLAYLTDAYTVRERFSIAPGGPPPYWLIVLDDVHHIAPESKNLLGALLQISQKTPLRFVLVSRTSLDFYDRRDVHMRDIVEELPLSGLSLDETSRWLEELDLNDIDVNDVHERTGGHPLAIEMLELYGKPTHEDWLRFLDEEILAPLPEDERELLATLAVAEKPIQWKVLAESLEWDGMPPQRLLDYGLLIELDQGMWLHEALRERLVREVGSAEIERRNRIE
ncbi:MAG: AAA family ATPase [Candidatus Thermoplasmatota archaeon]|nr:AAA family ATPase [Candidatus Thermoplasmatota archaeon]MEC7253677.1 AAA family ATPase [Candidatus Thermoplasmatota archaeon]